MFSNNTAEADPMNVVLGKNIVVAIRASDCSAPGGV